MIRTCMLFLLIMFSLSSCSGHKETYVDSNLTTSVKVDNLAFNKQENNAINDYVMLLTKIARKSNISGIQPTVVYETNPKLSFREVRIKANGSGSLIIVGSNRRLFVKSLYTYLNYIGARFYGPEDHWTFLPQIEKSRLVYDKIIEYPFDINQVSPSYAIANRRFKSFRPAIEKWDRWSSRLRFENNSYIHFGHYGTRFNIKYRELIESHPSWRAEVNGVRQDWSKLLKLCYTNPEVVELFKQDAESRLKELIAKSDPPYTINLEPSDKGGHCDCTSCQVRGSVSDNLYHMVNQVAIHIKGINKDANAFLLAYNEHAMPPTQAIQNNVIVGIVPDLFQSVGSPEKMMQLWEQKHDKLVFRSYLGLINGNYDKPLWLSAKDQILKINELKRRDYFGFKYEITPSFLSVGWNLYMISQVTNNSEINYESEWDKFMAYAFGSQARRIEPILIYLLNSNSNGLYLLDIRKKLYDMYRGSNGEIKKRIQDLIFYTDYLLLHFENQRSKSEENLSNLYNIISTDNGNLNLHSWGLFKIYNKKNGLKLLENSPEYTLTDYSRAKYDQDQIKIPEKQLGKSYSNIEWEPINKSWKGNDNNLVEITSRRGFVVKLYNNTPGTNLKLQLKGIGFLDNSKIYYTLSKDGVFIKEGDIKTSGGFEIYEMPLEDVGTYDLKIKRSLSDVVMRVPKMPLAIINEMTSIRTQKPINYYVYNLNNSLQIKTANKSGPISISQKENILYEDKQKIQKTLVTLQKTRPGIVKISTFRNNMQVLNQENYLSFYPQAVWKNK